MLIALILVQLVASMLIRDLESIAPGLLMNSFISSPVSMVAALIFSALLVSGCSGSSDTQSSASVAPVNAGDTSVGVGDNAAGSGAINDGTVGGGPNETVVIPAANEAVNSEVVVQDPVTQNPISTDPVVPDPQIQNTVRITFDIQVPAYQSDALQVRLTTDTTDITASWVGDEFWSASESFPTNTEQALTVTFSDDNGVITLGTVELTFTTGTNDAQTLQIKANDFDIGRWDSDNDGVSNLDELIAGSESIKSPRVLLFSETRDFRHDSIEVALSALEEIAIAGGIQTDRAADSAGLFTEANLAKYDAVVWVSTSGDVLDATEQAAFEQFIRAGGGYAGIHAASFTEYEWPWYARLVGAYFQSHPEIQSATQDIEDATHLSTAHLGLRWTRTDEWYDYRTNPRAQVNVLLTLDETSYTGGIMGDDHPSAWYHDYDGGRSWYTGGGHTEASYAEPEFRAHLLGGLQYAVARN